jgi:hypothetical protein
MKTMAAIIIVLRAVLAIGQQTKPEAGMYVSCANPYRPVMWMDGVVVGVSGEPLLIQNDVFDES